MTSQFAIAMNASAKTWNNAVSLASPDISGKTNGIMSLFFKSVRGINNSQLYQYISESDKESIIDTFLLSFYIRDCRGGKGERKIGREAFTWLLISHPDIFMKVLHLIPEYGRWDDITHFFPGVLDLSSIDNIKSIYNITIDNDHLNKVLEAQKQIVIFFADSIKKDYGCMTNGNPCTLAAKWAPTEGDSIDKSSHIFSKLAHAIGVSNKNLRKVYLTPLRSYINIVEKFMCDGKWNAIEYSKVPSHAMKRLKKTFEKHDKERFQQWKEALKKNDVKVCAKQLQPYEIIREIRIKKYADEVLEAQWKILEEEVRKIGYLEDAVIVVDTSSSMYTPNYLPLDVAVSLGIIISGLTRGKFHNHVITFASEPQFVQIKDGTIYERWNQVKSIPWGGNTNIQKTFELIINRGKAFNLSQNDMPKKLFIISDMQFDQINGEYGSNHITSFEMIDDMYKKSGYIRPQIIFWNVNGNSTDFPASVDDFGTALISGFSPEVMKEVLNGSDFSPYTIVRNTLDSERFSQIKNVIYASLDKNLQVDIKSSTNDVTENDENDENNDIVLVTSSMTLHEKYP